MSAADDKPICTFCAAPGPKRHHEFDNGVKIHCCRDEACAAEFRRAIVGFGSSLPHSKVSPGKGRRRQRANAMRSKR